MRTYSSLADPEIRKLLQLLVDPTPPEDYRATMTLLGEHFGRTLGRLLAGVKSLLVVCTNEDADFLARGVLNGLGSSNGPKTSLACFWNDRAALNGNVSLELAPIVRKYIEPGESDTILVLKSIVDGTRVARTNITEVVYDRNPNRVIIFAPVVLKGMDQVLRDEFDPEISDRFEFFWFAEDAEANDQGEVLPGIGGNVSARLGIFGEKIRYIPALVKDRRKAASALLTAPLTDSARARDAQTKDAIEDTLGAETNGIIQEPPMNVRRDSTKSTTAIGTDLEAEASRHRDWVIERIAEILGRIEDKTLFEKISNGISDILKSAGKDHTLAQSDAPETLARLIVTECDFDDLLICLRNGLMRKWEPFAVTDDKVRIAKITTYLLPLNYQPGLLEKLRADAKAGIRLVENIVSKKAIAEVLMAGIEAKEASFYMPIDTPDAIAGSFSIEVSLPPEAGPTDNDAALDRGAVHIIRQVLAIVHFDPDCPTKFMPDPIEEFRAEMRPLESKKLKSVLKSLALDLVNKLHAVAKVYERSLYCILTSPKPQQRPFVYAVIDRVTEHVPNLWFVELIPESKDSYQSGVHQHIVFFEHARPPSFKKTVLPRPGHSMPIC